MLVLNGQPLGYRDAHRRGETLMAGWVVGAVQFLPTTMARRDFAEINVPREKLIGRAHHVRASADWLGEDGWRLAPRFGLWVTAIR